MSGRFPPHPGEGHRSPHEPPHRARYAARSHTSTSFDDLRDGRTFDHSERPAVESNVRPPHLTTGGSVSLREAPKGPKALVDPPRTRGAANHSFSSAGPRGRPFFGRGDYRGRSFYGSRETRDSPHFRGDRDRDKNWSESDPRRDHRLSLPAKEHRGSSDYPQELDLDGARKGSKDGPLSPTSSSSDPAARLSLSWGRDRGGWSPPKGARGPVGDERESVQAAVRSRERAWTSDRDDREDQRGVGKWDPRKERSKRIEREEREREAERYKKDRVPEQPGYWTLPRPSAEPSSAHFSTTGSSRVSLGKGGSSGEIHQDLASGRHSSTGSHSYRSSSLGGPSSLVWKAPSLAHGTPQSSGLSGGHTPPKPPYIESTNIVASQSPKGLTGERLSDRDETTARQAGEAGKWDALRDPNASLVARSKSPAGASSTGSSADLSTTREPFPWEVVNHPIFPKPYNRPGSSSSAQGIGRGSGGQPYQSLGSIDSVSRAPSFSSSTVQIPTGPKADRVGRGRSNQWIRGGLSYPPGRGSSNFGAASVKRDHTGRERSRYENPGRSLVRHHPFELESDTTRDFVATNPAESAATPVDRATSTDGGSQQVEEDRDVNISAETGSHPEAVRSSKVRHEGQAADEEPDSLEEVDMADIWSNREEEIRVATALAQGVKDVAHCKKRVLQHVLHEAYVITRNTIAQYRDAPANMDPLTTTTASSAMAEPVTIPNIYQTDQVADTVEGSAGVDPQPADGETSRLEGPASGAEQAERSRRTWKRAKTPPIDSLPFLRRGLQQPFREIPAFQEQEKYFAENREALLAVLRGQMEDQAMKDRELKREWTEGYKKWRAEVLILDEMLGSKNDEAPDPEASAPESNSPAAQLTPVERRRGGRYASEHDMQEVLKLSAEEERERARKKTRTKIDDDKEAVIPDMLNDMQRRFPFRDNNRLVQPEHAVERFRFEPPVNDFTDEEQRIFVENLQIHGKQFGRIAAALPGRTFGDCIEHYYATKVKYNYKRLLKLKKTKKRGQTRAKSNALIRSDHASQPDAYEGDDADGPAAAVTDTGRPRRAAAPIFGEATGESGSSTPAPTPVRRTAAIARFDGAGDTPSERGTRRARGGAGREKGQRRAKNSLLAPAPTPSPAPTAAPPERERSRDNGPPLEDLSRDLENAQLLAGLQTGGVAVDAPTTMAEKSPTPLALAIGPLGDPARPSRAHQRAAAQTSSYWSVPESTDFPKLLDHFGTDWQGIAAHMTSKTHVMVKNFYKREVDGGRIEWKQRAEAADAKKRRGEEMGPPPAPTQSKRRHEPFQPSMPRPLAPSTDTEPIEIPDDSPKIHYAVPANASPPQIAQPATVPMFFEGESDLARAEPTFGNYLQPRTAMTTQQHLEQSRSQQQQGPRIGYFTETRAENQSTSQGGQAVPQNPGQQFRVHSGLQQQPLQPSLRPPVSSSASQPSYPTFMSSRQATSGPSPQPIDIDTPRSEVSSQRLGHRQHLSYELFPQEISGQKSDSSHMVSHVSSPAPRYVAAQAAVPIAPATARVDPRPWVTPGNDLRPTSALQPVTTTTTRKTSNIMSLLNATEPEEPVSRRQYDQAPAHAPAHAHTPPVATQPMSGATYQYLGRAQHDMPILSRRDKVSTASEYDAMAPTYPQQRAPSLMGRTGNPSTALHRSLPPSWSTLEAYSPPSTGTNPGWYTQPSSSSASSVAPHSSHPHNTANITSTGPATSLVHRVQHPDHPSAALLTAWSREREDMQHRQKMDENKMSSKYPSWSPGPFPH